MKNVRKQMLNGEMPASCIKCYKEEAAGHLSKRLPETDYWLNRYSIDEIIEDTKEDGSIPSKLDTWIYVWDPNVIQNVLCVPSYDSPTVGKRLVRCISNN